MENLAEERSRVLAAAVSGTRRDIPREFRHDREVVLATMQHRPHALDQADPVLKSDREFMLAAVTRSGDLLQYASIGLKQDREIVLAAIRRGGLKRAFNYGFYAHLSLSDDREVALAAVQNDGWTLGGASARNRADCEIVMAAVQQNGEALKFASPELRDNEEIWKAAVRNYGEAFAFLSQEARADRSIVLAAVQTNGTALRVAGPLFQADTEIVLAAVANNGLAIHWASETLADWLAQSAEVRNEWVTWRRENRFRQEVAEAPVHAKLQAYAQALSCPFLISVLGTQPLPTRALAVPKFWGRKNLGGGAAQVFQRWKIKVCTISGTEELVECTGDAYGNLSTASLRTQLATQLAKHPAALSFVLPSGTVYKEGSDRDFSAVYFLQKARM